MPQSATKTDLAYVYFIGAWRGADADPHALKVGWAIDPDKRVKDLQTGCPDRLALLAKIECRQANVVEKQLHALLAPHHLRGEWFRFTPESWYTVQVGRTISADPWASPEQLVARLHYETLGHDSEGRPNVRTWVIRAGSNAHIAYGSLEDVALRINHENGWDHDSCGFVAFPLYPEDAWVPLTDPLDFEAVAFPRRTAHKIYEYYFAEISEDERVDAESAWAKFVAIVTDPAPDDFGDRLADHRFGACAVQGGEAFESEILALDRTRTANGEEAEDRDCDEGVVSAWQRGGVHLHAWCDICGHRMKYGIPKKC